MRFGFASEEIHPEELLGEEAYIKNSISSSVVAETWTGR
jgi:hypothetical protein